MHFILIWFNKSILKTTLEKFNKPFLTVCPASLILEFVTIENKLNLQKQNINFILYP